MRNLRLIATVLFVAVLLVGIVLLLRQTNVQNDTSVTSTTQVTNQQIAANASTQTDPPKKKIRVGNTPLYLPSDKQPMRADQLQLKRSSSTANGANVATSNNKEATVTRLIPVDMTLKDISKNKNGINELRKQNRPKTKSK